jgi:hypothetical protein
VAEKLGASRDVLNLGLARVLYSEDSPAEESVERVVGDGEAVEELSDSGEHEEELQRVEELEILRCC